MEQGKRRKLWLRDRRACHYCGVDLRFDELTLDHVWPASRGGSNARWNLVACCAPCNVGFGSTTDKCSCHWCLEAVRLHFESLPGRKPAEFRYSMAEVIGFEWSSEGWRPYSDQRW